jgi:hypothetical protein
MDLNLRIYFSLPHDPSLQRNEICLLALYLPGLVEERGDVLASLMGI